MRFAIINCLSAKGDGIANDDAVGYLAGNAHSDFWVIDGATSVADRAYVPGESSDPAWFARTLSSELARASPDDELPVDGVLRRAIGRVRDRYIEAVGDPASVPVYAWPLASLTFVRISAIDGHFHFEGHCLGDCPAFAWNGAWVPLWQPQVNGDVPAYLKEDLDRTQLKERIRHRRAEQHAIPSIGVVALAPDCVTYAKLVRLVAGEHARLVLMSDGFARLFQEYRLIQAARVMEDLEEAGAAERLIGRLRAAERPAGANSRPLIYKNGDDATVLSVDLGHPSA